MMLVIVQFQKYCHPLCFPNRRRLGQKKSNVVRCVGAERGLFEGV